MLLVILTDISDLSVGFTAASVFLRAGMVRNSQSTTEVQREENKNVSKD